MPSIPSTIKSKHDKFVDKIDMIFVDPDKIEYKQTFTVQKGQEFKTLKQIVHIVALKWGITLIKSDHKYYNKLIKDIKLEGDDYKTGVLTVTVNVADNDKGFKQLTMKQRMATKK